MVMKHRNLRKFWSHGTLSENGVAYYENRTYQKRMTCTIKTEKTRQTIATVVSQT